MVIVFLEKLAVFWLSTSVEKCRPLIKVSKPLLRHYLITLSTEVKDSNYQEVAQTYIPLIYINMYFICMWRVKDK